MRALVVTALLFGSTLTIGCALGPSDDPEGHVGEAQQGQIDPGYRVSRQVTMIFADARHTPLASLYIFNQRHGSYRPGIEYWFVNRAAVELVGHHAIELATVDQDVVVDPPDPDSPDWQTFSQEEFPTSGWGSPWSADPLSFGTLYSDDHGHGLRLGVTTDNRIDEVAWEQVVPMTESPRYLTPEGRYSPGKPGLDVPSGSRGYSIDQAVP